jgi:hypothetical protein
MPAHKSNEMTSRERVFAAAQGLPHDRVPVMYLINEHAACKLMSIYQPGSNRIWNMLARFLWRRFVNGGMIDAPELWRLLPMLLRWYAYSDYNLEMGSDITMHMLGMYTSGSKFYRENGHIRMRDPMGVTRGMVGAYLEVIGSSITDVKDLKTFTFPDIEGDDFCIGLRKYRQEHPEACIMMEAFGVQDLFSTQIWEMTQFMLALYDYPDEIKQFQKRFGDWTIETIKRGVQAGADIVYLYDDYGYTGRPLISMDMWKEFTYPHLVRIVEATHHAGALFMQHSCGYQMPFLEHYAEAGVDILQGFQPKAGNDFKSAYEEYGDRLCFATGIDTQVGESMAPRELRESILKNYRIGKTRSRHILGMTHNLQYTMPEENIRAIFETVREIQEGKHEG